MFAVGENRSTEQKISDRTGKRAVAKLIPRAPPLELTLYYNMRSTLTRYMWEIKKFIMPCT